MISREKLLIDYPECKKSEMNWENTIIADRQRKARISALVEKATTRFHILTFNQTTLGTESEESLSYHNTEK